MAAALLADLRRAKFGAGFLRFRNIEWTMIAGPSTPRGERYRAHEDQEREQGGLPEDVRMILVWRAGQSALFKADIVSAF